MANLKPIYEKGTGRLLSYFIRVFRGRDSSGKQLKPWSTTFKVEPSWTKVSARKRAEAYAAVFEAKCKEGSISDSSQTFQEYAEYVISLKETRGIKATTISGYRKLSLRIYPAIGHIKLKDLNPTHLNNFYSVLSGENNKNYSHRAYPRKEFSDLLKQKHMTRKDLSNLSGVALHTVAETVKGKDTYEEAGRKIADVLGVDADTLFTFTAPTAKISPKTIKEHHRFIHMVLAQAVREGLIPINPADRVELPHYEKKEPNYFTIEQLNVIEEKLEAESLRWRTLVYMYMTTGCRRGEILALKWDDIDFNENQVYIHSNLLYTPEKGVYSDTPKTKKSVRHIALPEQMMALLKQYETWQIDERQRLGDFYQNDDYVFTRNDGSPMRPDCVTRWMKKFGEKCGFKINPHAFRHSMVSILCYSGLDIVSISKRLGHSDISTTTDIYAHIMDKADKKTAEALGNVLFPD